MREALLLLRPGALGDALLTCPALGRLRTCRPDLQLIVVGQPSVRDLLVSHGLADHFISQDSPQADALFASDSTLARARWPRLSAAMLWVGNAPEELRRNVAALGVNPVLVAPSRPPGAGGEHVAQHLIRTLAPLGVSGLAADWGGFPALRAVGTSLPTLSSRPLVVVHPGSGSPRKNWPACRFAQVAVRLRAEAAASVVVLIGPADQEALSVMSSAKLPGEVMREPQLLDLAALLASCDLYLGNDSGISHLAGLSGAPSLVLFGPTDPQVWRPLGPRVTVLRRQPLDSLAVEEVLRAALERLQQRRA